jgi:hypothetical protein
MQFAESAKPPVGVVFDTTMGRSIDEALALALLHGLEGKSEARIVSVSVINPDLEAAEFCDVIGRFYASSGDVSPSGFVHTLPVGLSTDRQVPSAGTVPMLKAALPAQPGKNDIQKLNDTAEPTALIRNALTAQYDGNAIVILTGPATNLVKVLSLPGASQLIASKVRMLCWAATDFNIKTDLGAARRLIAEWPTSMVSVGQNLGDALRYPRASIEKDFTWSAAHPIVQAYRAWKPMPYDAAAPDLAAVLYALRPKEKYFQLSGLGAFSVLDDKLAWKADASGRHQTLSLDPPQQDRVIKAYTELISAKPVPKQVGKRPKKQEPKVPDAKAPEPKVP